MQFHQLFSVIASGKAAKNWYDQTGDPEDAFNAAWGAFVRWSVWTIAFGVWWFMFFGFWLYDNAPAQFLNVAISPFLLGVTWNRIFDFCLFRQGLVYKLFRPLAGMVEPVPTWAFYCLPILPLAL